MEGRQADVRDFFLTESDYVTRCSVLRRFCWTNDCSGCAARHYKARTEAVSNLLAAAPDRVAVFHPVGFPGRTAFIRTTSIIVDDV